MTGYFLFNLGIFEMNVPNSCQVFKIERISTFRTLSRFGCFLVFSITFSSVKNKPKIWFNLSSNGQVHPKPAKRINGPWRSTRLQTASHSTADWFIWTGGSLEKLKSPVILTGFWTGGCFWNRVTLNISVTENDFFGGALFSGLVAGIFDKDARRDDGLELGFEHGNGIRNPSASIDGLGPRLKTEVILGQ